ncbi:MAG: hypothetical protein FJ303_21605 [Planctomycetes bacterium]|nr:hypothetical protein [Planctomycetota bacterium]
MIDTPSNPPEEFAPTPEHEYQDSHYHDEEPDIVNDEMAARTPTAPVSKKRPARRPPPKKRHYED